MLYKIYEVEEAVTKAGKPMKRCVLKGENQENTEPRVAVWDNFPDFDKIVAGGTVRGIIDKKDSGIPIPAHPEKNYVNRTLLPEGTQFAGDLESRVKKLEDKVFGVKEAVIEYPQEPTQEPPF